MFSEFLKTTDARNGALVPRRTMYLCMLQEMPIKIQATTFRRKALVDWKFHEAWRSGEDWELLLRFTRSHQLGFIDRRLVVQRAMPDSTFARYRKVDAQFLTRMFIREKKNLRGDSEATRVVTRIIASKSNTLGYLCRDDGELISAAKAYFTGFCESGDFRLLARIGTLAFPSSVRTHVIGLWHALEAKLATLRAVRRHRPSTAVASGPYAK